MQIEHYDLIGELQTAAIVVTARRARSRSSALACSSWLVTNFPKALGHLTIVGAATALAAAEEGGAA